MIAQRQEKKLLTGWGKTNRLVSYVPPEISVSVLAFHTTGRSELIRGGITCPLISVLIGSGSSRGESI